MADKNIKDLVKNTHKECYFYAAKQAVSALDEQKKGDGFINANLYTAAIMSSCINAGGVNLYEHGLAEKVNKATQSKSR